jgi:hypothetical protein
MGKLGKANTELLDSAMKQKVKEKKKLSVSFCYYFVTMKA